MSEEAAEVATETVAGETTEQATKPTETVEFWKAKAREQEKRAKENAEARKELESIREAQKSETEKAADRMRRLEEEAAAARCDALRFKVASKHGIGDEDADLFLTGSDEETLTRQAVRLSVRSEEQKKRGNRVPREGTSTQPVGDDERAVVRDLFAGG